MNTSTTESWRARPPMVGKYHVVALPPQRLDRAQTVRHGVDLVPAALQDDRGEAAVHRVVVGQQQLERRRPLLPDAVHGDQRRHRCRRGRARSVAQAVEQRLGRHRLAQVGGEPVGQRAGTVAADARGHQEPEPGVAQARIGRGSQRRSARARGRSAHGRPAPCRMARRDPPPRPAAPAPDARCGRHGRSAPSPPRSRP